MLAALVKLVVLMGLCFGFVCLLQVGNQSHVTQTGLLTDLPACPKC